ncbi:MAG: serine/threonine-protein kinase [Sandaracinaceae bacterium]
MGETTVPDVLSGRDTSIALPGDGERRPDRFIVPPIDRDDTGLLGQRVDGHRLVSVLGAGGTGVVFRAEGDDGAIAVKVLRKKHGPDSDAAQRFLRESRLEGLRHPNIVTVRSAGLLEDGRPYLTMELLRGESLERRLGREVQLPIEDAVRITREVLAGLGAAHEAGVVHRDVKPANVFLAETGEGTVAKLLDFSVARVAAQGGARVTATGDIVGTPLYLAPEQATGVKTQDHRVDVWAAGVLLYHLLTGEPPFASKQLAELILKIVSETPRDPRSIRDEIPEPLAEVVRRALKKPVSERYASAREMARALSDAC